jgi:hypothetical protein
MGQEIGSCWHPTSEIVVAPPDEAVCQACGQKVDWSQDADADLVARLDLAYEWIKARMTDGCD